MQHAVRLISATHLSDPRCSAVSSSLLEPSGANRASRQNATPALHELPMRPLFIQGTQHPNLTQYNSVDALFSITTESVPSAIAKQPDIGAVFRSSEMRSAAFYTLADCISAFGRLQMLPQTFRAAGNSAKTRIEFPSCIPSPLFFLPCGCAALLTRAMD